MSGTLNTRPNRINPQPQKCLERKPTGQTVLFCRGFISLTALAFITGLHLSTVSYIFSGKRNLTLKAARKISKALGMGLEEFINGLDSHLADKRYNPKLPKLPKIAQSA